MACSGWRRRALGLHAALCALFVRAALSTGSVRFAVRAARVAGTLCRTRASVAECVGAGTAAADAFAHRTCLYRALTVYALLVPRHGLSQFHLGAAHTGTLAAHAWTSVGGTRLDPEAERYSTLWTAPAEG